MKIRFEDFLKLNGACVPDLKDNPLDYRYIGGLDERFLWVVGKALYKHPPDQIFKGTLLIQFPKLSQMPSHCRIRYVLNGEPLRQCAPKWACTPEYAHTINELHEKVIVMLGKWKLTGENS